ncbi:hypothetical protein JCGZ_16848 [Jatropha curcas]|uniref:Basic blue protein n=1 Tax=Jatropha curcas TaxID=180498 RepID=A0A067L513_JATCU|nr:basic blue protein [Jatropha curcas]KDP43561.1 hypothetical protein JCGZ_16848 [Jatropha curcas]
MAREGVILAILMLMAILVLHCKSSHGAKPPATYTVGDGYGWSITISMEAWAKGKKFYAGDILVFKYDYQDTDVVVVDRKGFETCTVTPNATVYESGYDKIQLRFGPNYFISSNPDNCQSNMKMAINAAARPPARGARKINPN